MSATNSNLFTAEEFLKRRDVENDHPLNWSQRCEQEVLESDLFFQGYKNKFGKSHTELLNSIQRKLHLAALRQNETYRLCEMFYWYSCEPKLVEDHYGTILKNTIDQVKHNKIIQLPKISQIETQRFFTCTFAAISGTFIKYWHQNNLELSVDEEFKIRNSLRTIYRKNDESILAHYEAFSSSNLKSWWFGSLTRDASLISGLRGILPILKEADQHLDGEDCARFRKKIDQAYAQYAQLP